MRLIITPLERCFGSTCPVITDYAGIEKSSRWNSVGPIKKREHLILRGVQD